MFSRLKRLLIFPAFALASSTLVPAAQSAPPPSDSGFFTAVDEEDGQKVLEMIDSLSGPRLVNAVNRDTGQRPLHIVTEKRRDNWLKFFLDKGADINGRDGDGRTALLYATRLNWVEGIDLLIKRGADVNAADKRGVTPLIEAVQLRYPIAVEKLLAAGADPERTDSQAGFSALDYARRMGPQGREIVAKIEASQNKDAEKPEGQDFDFSGDFFGPKRR